MTALFTAWPVDLGILAAMFLLAAALTLLSAARRDLRELRRRTHRDEEDDRE